MESVVSAGELQLKHKLILSFSIVFLLEILSYSIGCQQTVTTTPGKKSIVVTYSILGAVVKDLIGDSAEVKVSIPNGLDPHEWDPSAKDIEAINHADLVVQNGLGLENGMQKALQTAQKNGVRFFTASDYITVRHVGPGEGIPSGSPDQLTGAADPHLWMDPLAIKSIISALSPVLTLQLGLDVTARAIDLENRLDALNNQIVTITSAVPADGRKLVTGHESMGYFAQRYNFQLIGVIVPSLSTQADVSASDLAALKKVIQDNKVKAIFTELGTPANVAKQIGDESGVKVVSLSTHILPPDGSYFTFMSSVANTITGALK